MTRKTATPTCPHSWLRIEATDDRGSNEVWTGLLGFGAYEATHKEPSLSQWREANGVRTLTIWVDYVPADALRPPEITSRRGSYELDLTRPRGEIAVMDMATTYGQLRSIFAEAQALVGQT